MIPHPTHFDKSMFPRTKIMTLKVRHRRQTAHLTLRKFK